MDGLHFRFPRSSAGMTRTLSAYVFLAILAVSVVYGIVDYLR